VSSGIFAPSATSGDAILSRVQLGLPFGRDVTSPGAGDVGRARNGPERLPLGPRRPGRAGPADDLAALGPLYFIRLRRARRYRLRVDEDGRLRVTIPRGGSQREAGVFAARHVEWVGRQRQRLTARQSVLDDAAIAERAEQRARARALLPARLHELARAHGLAASRVSVRSQRTRWGSCGRDGHISLNWRLVLMPDWVRDYVLVHELMHLRRLDHSPKYWSLVAAACPAYREARAWLRAHGPSLR
jgi:predicted metal-dependent hydrolase